MSDNTTQSSATSSSQPVQSLRHAKSPSISPDPSPTNMSPVSSPREQERILNKQIAFFCTKEMEEDDLERLRQMGKVYIFKNIDASLRISDIEFDYIIFDVHNEIHVNYIMNQDLSALYEIAYCRFYEKNAEWIDEYHVLKSVCHIPEPQPSRSMFNSLLVNKKIHKPERAITSLFTFLKKKLLKD